MGAERRESVSVAVVGGRIVGQVLMLFSNSMINIALDRMLARLVDDRAMSAGSIASEPVS
jgi:hypothetical protein